MKDFEKLKNHIREEIRDAEDYIRDALACKDTCPERAEVYRRLAEEELGHMEALHAEIVREIKKWQAENGNPPPDMQAKYNVLHEIFTGDANKVRLMIKLYKEAGA